MVEQHWLNLFVKLAVSAALASILTRFGAFQRMLMREERTLIQRLHMAFVGGLLYGAGVTMRVLGRQSYQAIDLGLEGSLVLGMLGGYVTGLLAGVLISIPAMLNGEYLTMLLLGATGVMGGLLRDLAPDYEYIWKISPIPELWRKDIKIPLFSLSAVAVIVLAESIRYVLAFLFPPKLVFAMSGYWGESNPGITVAIFATSVLATILPIKIWNSSRNEKRLEQQQLRLNEARLAALSSQINPHFLFNTLNSVASLIRINPEEARRMIYSLSKILRRVMKQQDNYASLREELAFIDDYLAIEMMRFGEKLRFVKEIQEDTKELPIPSMVLQPIIENSIRHGLSSKVDGGTICLRSRLEGGCLQILVEDNGVGIPEAKLARLYELGIGISNVNERLKVLYGDRYRMWIDSRLGEGTTTCIELPMESSGTVVGVDSRAGSPATRGALIERS